jgi:hypothetical protein
MMNTTELSPAGTTAQPIGQPIFQPGVAPQRSERAVENVPDAEKLGPQRSGYGMPCAKCRTYYAADLRACPVCKSTERVSPRGADLPQHTMTMESVPDPAMVEQERERFLREFQSQVQTSPVQVSSVQVNATASYRCSQERNHPGGFGQASICQGCYDHLQERVDQMEAAMHMDTKEAAQIVYDAVWADPSDPSRTYQNAAESLLAELRRRAGIQLLLGSLQPLPD